MQTAERETQGDPFFLSGGNCVLLLLHHGGLFVIPGPMANTLVGLGVLWAPAWCGVSPGAGPGRGSERRFCRSFTEAGQRGTVCPCSCCPCPLTPLENIRLEDPGLPDISTAVPSTGSHSPLSRTLSCPNYATENGLEVRKKKKSNQEHPNAALDLASVAPNSWQRHQEKFEAACAASLLPPAHPRQRSQV